MDPSTYEHRKQLAFQSKQRSMERKINRLHASPEYMLREYLNQIRISNRSGSHEGCFRYFPNNKDEHEDCKYAVYKLIRKASHKVIVEPIFLNGSRADVVDLSLGIIYEVTFTETEEELKKKIEKYPDCFEIVRIDAHNMPDCLKDVRL